MPHMQGFIRIPEPKSNRMIHILNAVLEFGGTINWADDTDGHATCDNVGVTIEGQATEVGNRNHVQSMNEATRDDTDRHETCDNVGVTNEGHATSQATEVGPEESQGDKVDWFALKAYIDQQCALIRSEIALLPSKIISLLQQ